MLKTKQNKSGSYIPVSNVYPYPALRSSGRPQLDNRNTENGIKI